MTLAQLQYLIAIADADLNISVAAARIGANQSSVSQQLKQLETSLGCPLFIRRGRRLVRPSPVGGQILTRARALLAEVEALRAVERTSA
jgi:LysR family cys regulon transcriptional activator